MWLLGGLSSFAVGGLRASVLTGFWLEATLSCLTRGLLQVASSEQVLQRMEERETERERERTRWKSVFYNLIMEVTFAFITLATFYLLETSH